VGPLELLYEFGELVRSNPGCLPLNELHRPVVLLGPWTSYIGTPEQCPKNWEDEMVGRHKHTIIEGSEPSTGLRYASCVYLRYDIAVGHL
jgi:hypothetical protein